MFKPVIEFTEKDIKSTGLTESTLNLFAALGFNTDNFYKSCENPIEPVCYFENETNFMYNFTKFQNDWTTVVQIDRFVNAYKKHALCIN